MDFEIIRFLFAFLCGYFLTVSGSLSQLVTNNSIASPSTLGMDGAAVLFVIISQFFVVLVGESIDPAYIAYGLFLISSSLFFLVFSLRKKSKDIWNTFNIQSLILFGLAFNLFVGAIFSIIQFLFMSLNFQFPTGIWFGSLKQYEANYIYLFLCVFFMAKIFLIKYSAKLELLNLGRSIAEGLGVDVSKVQRLSLGLSFILTGTVICYFGVFSFLGLIFPHILRSFSWFKKSMKAELIYGPYISGIIFSIVDQFCYQFDFYGAELPVGMVSSVIGAIFLIILVLKSKISRV